MGRKKVLSSPALTHALDRSFDLDSSLDVATGPSPLRFGHDPLVDRLGDLASLGYRRVGDQHCLPAGETDVLIGPAGVFLIGAHYESRPRDLTDADALIDDLEVAEAVQVLAPIARLLEDAVGLDPNAVSSILCLASPLSTGHGRLDGAHVVSVNRLRAWFMVQPSVLTAPQESVLFSRIARRPASSASGQGAAA